MPSQDQERYQPGQYQDRNQPCNHLDRNQPCPYLDRNQPCQHLDRNHPCQYLDIDQPCQYLDINQPCQHQDIDCSGQLLDVNQPGQLVEIWSSEHQDINQPGQLQGRDQLSEHQVKNCQVGVEEISLEEHYQCHFSAYDYECIWCRNQFLLDTKKRYTQVSNTLEESIAMELMQLCKHFNAKNISHLHLVTRVTMLLQGHPELLEGFTKLVPEMVFLARAYLPASSTSSGDQSKISDVEYAKVFINGLSPSQQSGTCQGSEQVRSRTSTEYDVDSCQETLLCSMLDAPFRIHDYALKPPYTFKNTDNEASIAGMSCYAKPKGNSSEQMENGYLNKADIQAIKELHVTCEPSIHVPEVTSPSNNIDINSIKFCSDIVQHELVEGETLIPDAIMADSIEVKSETLTHDNITADNIEVKSETLSPDIISADTIETDCVTIKMEPVEMNTSHVDVDLYTDDLNSDNILRQNLCPVNFEHKIQHPLERKKLVYVSDTVPADFDCDLKQEPEYLTEHIAELDCDVVHRQCFHQSKDEPEGTIDSISTSDIKMLLDFYFKMQERKTLGSVEEEVIDEIVKDSLECNKIK